MIRGIYHSAAGMMPRYHQLTSISNNLANASTISFKADRQYFRFTLNNELTQPGLNGLGKNMNRLNEGLYTEFDQGSLKATQLKTDFALNGPGFFVVQDPDSGETLYTRDGRFSINEQRELVTPSGYGVLDDSYAPIVVPDGPFFVDKEGGIFIDGQHTANFMIAEFEDPNILQKKGGNLYEVRDGRDIAPAMSESTAVLQEHLELSNVDIIREMVEMISLSRSFDTSQRSLTSQDNSLARLIDRVPRF